MLRWSELLSHGNEIPFFNDSCSDIQPSTKELIKFTKKINPKYKTTKLKKNFFNLKQSGYFIYSNKNYKLIFRSGGVSANSIPAHQHANTLSFELSNKTGKILSNSGISTYENCPLRLYERGSLCQNTISINNLNTMDVWKSFRVGKRPIVKSGLIKNRERKITFFAEHNGFSRIF